MPDAQPPAGDPPTPPAADVSPFDDLEKKIRFVCLQITRGRRARFRWEVGVYYTLRVVSVVLSAAAATGLIADKVSANLTAVTGWAFWGALIVLAFGILLQIADVFGVEKAATHARVLAAQAKLYQTELGLILSDEYPTNSVDGLAERVKASLLDPNNNATLPDEDDPKVQGEAARWSAALIARNRGVWKPPPQTRRKPK